MEALLAVLGSMFRPDERFIMHRYLSTRIAMVVGLAAMWAWFTYELLAHDLWRWDLVVIAGAMAVTKLAAMAYLEITR